MSSLWDDKEFLENYVDMRCILAVLIDRAERRKEKAVDDVA